MRVALIGVGYWGPNYARIFHELSGVTLATAVDLDERSLSRISQRHPNVRTTRDAAEVWRDASIDAVVVATPARTHFKIVRDALAAGKHVLVEKPLTTSAAEARELVALARAKGRVLMVGHVFEFNSGVERMKQLLDAGELGKLYYLYAVRTGLGPIREDVNAMWDLVPHDVSILLYLLGEKPSEVHAHGGAFLRAGREDVVFVTLRFPTGVLAHIHASWIDPHKIRRTTLIGDKKMLVFDDVNTTEPIRIYEKGADKHANPPGSFAEFQIALRDGDIHIPKVQMREPLKAEVEHFVACVRDGIACRTDGEDGLRVVEVCERIEEALKRKVP